MADSSGSDNKVSFAGTERTSATRALRHIVIGALFFAVVTGVYAWQARKDHAAKMLVRDARTLVQKHDVPSLVAARDKLAEALEVEPNHDAAIASMAEVNTLLWVDHGVDDAKDQALDFVGRARADDIERAERYGAEGLAAYGEGRHDECVSVISRILERGAISDKLYWPLGLCLRAKGEAKAGRENLRRAAESAAYAPHYAVALGDAYEDDGDARNAHLYWENAFKANPGYLQGTARALIARLRRGEDPKAVRADLDKLDALPPTAAGRIDRSYIESTRAELLSREGKLDKALEAANKAIELGGESSRRLSVRGRLTLAMGKSDQGVADMTAAHHKQPLAERYFYDLARVYSETGKHAEALKLLESQRDKRPEEGEFFVALGDALRQKGDLDAAAKNYDKALELEEGNAEAMLGHGVIAWRKKKYDNATEWFEKAVGARQRFPAVYEAIGLMWIEQGAASNANTQLEHAEKLFKQTGADAARMQRFYTAVVKSLKDHKSSSLAAAWASREKAFRDGT